MTGAPGVGKSLLTDRLIDDFVGKGRKVGALLTDPSSPVTQGALLGDGVISRGEVTCSFHGWHFDLVTGKSGDGLEECVAVHEVRVSQTGMVEVAIAAPGA